MGIKYLWDTNTVIYFLQQQFPPQAEKFIDDTLKNSKPAISVITEIRKAHKIKLPDAVIAATELAYDLILMTRNISDFKKIEELNLINPHQAQRLV